MTQPLSLKSADDLHTACLHLQQIDPVFKRLYAQNGDPKPRWTGDGFSGLVTIILGQQISVAVAESHRQKFYTYLGISYDTPTALTPQMCANRTHWKNDLPLTQQKINYIGVVADAILNGELDLNALTPMTDENIIKTLTQLKGIGRWSAENYALFCMGRCDLFPAGDLGVAKAMGDLWGNDLWNTPTPTETQMRTLAENFRPYRGVVALMLWQHYRTMQTTK